MCPGNHAAAAFCCRSQNDLGTECAHDFATLDRKGLDHGGNKGVSHYSAHHGQRDSRIATGGFDHRLPWLQRAAVPRILNDRVSQSVFYGRHGVEGLNFHIHIDMLRRYPIELDDGRVADGLQYVVIFHSDLHKALGCAGSASFAGVIMADMQVTNMGHHHQNNT